MPLVIHAVLGLIFLISSSVAYFTMLHLMGSDSTAKHLRLLHRISGLVAVTLFIIISVICLISYRDSELLPRGAIHFASAALFIPLVIIKIVIVEKYPELRNRLLTFGTIVYSLVFLIFFTSSAYTLIGFPHGKAPETTQLETKSLRRDLVLGKDLFISKCSKCHRLDIPLSASLTSGEWKATIKRMRQKDSSWISKLEAEQIADFLIYLSR